MCVGFSMVMGTQSPAGDVVVSPVASPLTVPSVSPVCLPQFLPGSWAPFCHPDHTWIGQQRTVLPQRFLQISVATFQEFLWMFFSVGLSRWIALLEASSRSTFSKHKTQHLVSARCMPGAKDVPL